MRSRSTSSVALGMLRDLAGFESLAERMNSTAPEAVRAAGGPAELVSRYGEKGGAGFWAAQLPEAVWEAMAAENQRLHRG